jgi:hypothetical protein
MVPLVEEAAEAHDLAISPFYSRVTMRIVPALLVFLPLMACVSPDGSTQGAYQVTYDGNYLWPVEMPGHPEVDVMPYIPAMVVTRRDGAPLFQADEAAAHSAVVAHCAALGQRGPSTSSRFADGAWAFNTCQS